MRIEKKESFVSAGNSVVLLTKFKPVRDNMFDDLLKQLDKVDNK